VLMGATTIPSIYAVSQVAADVLQKIGFNLDFQTLEWGTVVQRRASKEPMDKGGWSLFCTSFPAVDYLDPLSAPALRGNGGAAWYGWPTVPKIEELRDTWLDSSDAAERKKLCAAIQLEAFQNGMFIPLGQYFQSAAWRKNITGHLKGPVPVFWNVEKV
jgi:peptide/nickel transport system substrate-binding protein